MLRRVALVRTNVSKEPGASFIKVTRIGELGTTQAATSKFLIDLTADNNTEYSLWKATQYLKRPITQVPPIRKADGQ
jgi:hypothetical protein